MYYLKLLTKTVMYCLLLLTKMSLIAQDSIANKILEAVVVTGQLTPQTLKSSVYQVRVINKERIQQQGATNLQTVLSVEPNIRFTQDVATGGPTSGPAVRTDRYYIIKDGNNNYYKIRFTALTQAGERGYTAFESILVKKG